MYLLSVCMDVSPSHVSLCVAVDGGWGPWSLWTACGVDCGRQRSRDCAEPEPRHGGRPCDGPGLGGDNCTGGLCIQNGKLLHDIKPQEVESSSDVVLYSGLSAGVLMVVVLIVVVTLYQRSYSEYSVDVIDSSALTGGFQSFTYKTSRQVWSGNPLLMNSSMQPDLSGSWTYTSPMCFQDSMDKELMADHSLLDPLPDIMVKVP
ncbi:netrin receptor UNC5D-like [Gadus macrocephalus]|uniref:netrin receptor UNC5D-like n=1 Tax=Gadus macrocephalus TaxID=80720 RepID=UPI0028CB3517|nr:netrin receptor UNC5D-like [Gadus macrocephalus]